MFHAARLASSTYAQNKKNGDGHIATSQFKAASIRKKMLQNYAALISFAIRDSVDTEIFVSISFPCISYEQQKVPNKRHANFYF